MSVTLDGRSLSLADLVAVARAGAPVALSDASQQAMRRSRAWVEDLAEGRRLGPNDTPLVVYGVNTGFGSLARVHIPFDQVRELMRNLIRSHAAGIGPSVDADAARAMVLLRANALARGASGCRPALVELLVALLNAGITPVIPSRGSCGSSGDLAPLSHLGLIVSHAPEDPDVETGSAWVDGELVSGREALARRGLTPLVLGPKEGLAINNGAQLTTAIAALAAFDAERLVLLAEIAAAMSIEALRGVTRAFHPAVHALRPYTGALACAANLRTLLAGSGLTDTVKGKVQDAYSLRCTPTVLGAARDTVAHASSQVRVELNAVTDNPVICLDADDEDAFSAGLFHGEPVGIAADVLKIAVAELASLSERRLFRLTTGNLSAQLPASLRHDDRPGVGLFGLQTTAAALVSENKSLAWPASVDSLPTCEDQEDHVAMSTTAARRAAEVVGNAEKVIAIELLCAARALRYRLDQEPGLVLGAGTGPALRTLEAALSDDQDATPSERVPEVLALMRSDALLAAVEAATGPLVRVGEAP